MAEKAGKLNPDEFSDLEPVLDDDSFAFDFEEDDSLSASNNEELDFGLDPGMEPPELEDINTLDKNDEDAFDFGTESLDGNDSEGINNEEDDFSLDVDPEEIGLDSMVSSAGDEYPDDTTSLDLDLDNGLDLIDEDSTSEAKVEIPSTTQQFDKSEDEEEVLLDAPNLFTDIDEPTKSSNPKPTQSNSVIENNENEFSLELEIDDDDPLIDEKIDQIVNQEDESSSISFENKESNSEFNFDDLDAEDEPITLSLDELENIVAVPMTELDEESLERSAEIDDEFSTSEENDEVNDKNYTDDELDQILGTDIYEEDEKEAGLLDLESTDLDIAFDDTTDSNELADSSLLDYEDMSDEPIALSMDELQNIMAEGEEGTESENLALDLDIDTPPENLKDDIDFTDFENENEINEADVDLEESDDSIFTEDELADEPITLSMDELENIAAFDETTENESEDLPAEDSDEVSNEELEESEEEDIFNEGEIDEEDEPITLSMDELSNITGDEDAIGSAFDDTLPDTSLDESSIGWAEESSESDEDESESSEASEQAEKPDLDEEFSDLTSDIDLTDDESAADEPITLSIDELSAITADPEDSSDIFSEEDLQDHSPASKNIDKEEDFDIGDDFSSAFDEEDSSDNIDSEKESDDEESIKDLDDFSSLPEPDDSVDFEEFTLEDDDVSSEDVNKLSESEENDDQIEFESTELLDGEDEDESITLSDDELGNILGGEDELPALSDFEDSVDLTEDIAEETSIDELQETVDENEETEEISFDENDFDGIDESETIDEPEAETIDEVETDSKDELDDESDEPIALTSEELTDIIGDLPPGEDLEDLDSLSFDDNRSISQEENIKPSLDPNDFDDETMVDLDEYSVDGGLSPLDEMRSTPSPLEEPKEVSSQENDESAEPFKDSQGNELSNEDKKKVLSYLDNLLGNLPDDMIREFSKSNYFDLYKKLMKEIGL